MVAMVMVALLSHGINMFHYPLYLGDEGIYLEQAWAVLREGQLAPYTYFYDHAPAGWLQIAVWELLLPFHFLTFGMSINSARVFMLVLDAASVALLYRLTRNLTRGSDLAAIAACLAFTLSPIEVYYQRMVLLDNVMVPWLLLSLDLLLVPNQRLTTVLAAGFSFGVAIVCKENALFFAPIIGYLLYQQVKDSFRMRFALVGWIVCAVMVVSLYPVYALLKGEFFPADALIGNGQPAAHVSMISTALWQMSRHGTSILTPGSQFWQYFWGMWWYKDPIIIVIGTAATVVNAILGLSNRTRNRDALYASLLAISFILYLIRGSVMIDFYVVPVLPFFALNVGIVLDRVARVAPPIGSSVAVIGIMAMTFGFLSRSHDMYFVDQTTLQADQLQFIRQNVPTNAYVLIDDDLWVDMHEPWGNNPVYQHADSHWKIAGDPAIYSNVLHDNWQNIDYLVMSNQLHYIFELNGEQMALQAYDHSRLLARFEEGDVELEVRQVIKNGGNS
jgi:4-amino-4-deoxy-L-arabinose transferase-like glycosyltransferase